MPEPMPVPPNEIERLVALRNCYILDTPPSPAFDDLTYLAADICGSVAASVTLIDEKRQWFKSIFGYPITETPREFAFCAHTIMGTHQLIVRDLLEDDRFRDNPFVVNEPHVRFYAGTPITTTDGYNIGSLCVYDREPRELTLQQSIAVGVLARQAAAQIELGKRIVEQESLVGRLVELNATLGSLATMDALTGLRNRRAFDETLRDEWARTARYNTPLSLIMFDIDRFKHFNDTCGHIGGDEVLRRVGGIVNGVSRSTNTAARYGGEEFAIIVPHTDGADATILAERVRKAIAYSEWDCLPVTASFGVASANVTMSGPSDLIELADKALYQSKAQGRNRVTWAATMPVAVA